MADIDASDSIENLIKQINCGNDSFTVEDWLRAIARLSAGTYQILSGEDPDPTPVIHVITANTGTAAATPVTAGLQSVDIQLLAPIYDGSNEVTATASPGFVLSNNPDVGRFGVQISAADFGRNAELPAITFVNTTGTPTIQWIGLSNN